MSGCDMVTGWKANEHGEPGDEIVCGAPIFLPSESGGGFCRAHADETAADGLDNFTKADAVTYQALIAEDQATVPA